MSLCIKSKQKIAGFATFNEKFTNRFIAGLSILQHLRHV
ncbi:hypothetical protein RD1_4129 [Roseobacter denitrificans OCh 114]|uniref:Uncharacterized protein n=1 Tax=Roseobacter denitrificans (strain ATCC 33942 / OCh 114) TaxID=375451 RepID=Q160M4_ROSDO|nr:hypothetical protein RD1_4129 [Roseobacter denitrificans OCh 114]